MGRGLGAVLAVVLAAGAVLGARALGVEPETWLNVLMAAVCLAWLGVVLVLPWNLHFQAREVLADMARSRQRGIRVDDAREVEVRRVARRALWVSVLAHVASAGAVGAAAWGAGWTAGYAFCALYVVSTLFRPAHAAHRHVWARLTEVAREVRHPRDDVMSMLGDVSALKASVTALDMELRHLRKERTDEHARLVERVALLEQRMESMARVFEDSVNRLTDNREVISGIKAFLRLIRADGA